MVIEILVGMMLGFGAPGPGKGFYFTADGGCDVGNGSFRRPWRTLASLARVRRGDTVFLQGRFESGLRLGRAHSGVVVSSYGTGNAVVHSVVVKGAQDVVIMRLEVKGAGRLSANSGNGVMVDSCSRVVVDSVLVQGFQKAGLLVRRSAGIDISGVHARQNGFAGISIEGTYGTRDCHDIRVRRCRAEDNPGDPTNLRNHSGNGIVVGNCARVLIEECVATGNGWDMPRIGNGPVGIWAYEADSVTIRRCVSYRNRTAKGADDGGGFDLDGGVAHSVIEHCVSYENEGSGYGLFQYAGASPWHDNSVHDCVSRDDGQVSAARAGFFVWNSTHDPEQQRNCAIYKNQVINSRGAVIHFASEGQHRGFRWFANSFEAADSLIKGRVMGDDVFWGNEWRGRLAAGLDTVGPRTPGAAGRDAEEWKDEAGQPINAHGAGMLYHEGVWYLFGEIKQGPTRLVPGQAWEDYRVEAGGVSCYASRDLEHWHYAGVALSPNKTDTASDIHTSRVIERPKVVYNPGTRQFVMWMHIDREDYSYARTGVAVSNRPEGPYKYLRSIRPDGAMSRDMTLFKDEDGKAYLVYSSEDNNTMHVSRLTADYLAPAGQWRRILVDQRREAPAVYRHRGKYYLITSLCTGWDPNAAEVAVADSMMGEWRVLGNPCKGPGGETTFSSQSTYVLPLGADRFLFMADRWNKTDLQRSRYLWLLLEMRGGMPEIRQREVVVVRRPVRPLSVVEYSLLLAGRKGMEGASFIRWFDGTGAQLTEVVTGFVCNDTLVRSGNYVEAPAVAAEMEVGFRGGLDLRGLMVGVVRDSMAAPLCDVNKYMQPFQTADTVFDETVLMVASGKDAAHGLLMFQPDKIISVKNYGGDTVFGRRDYRIRGREILRRDALPYVMDSAIHGWYNLQSRWITVTYTHHDKWRAPLSQYRGDLLPGVLGKLHRGEAVSVVAYGMSITRGMDVSGYDSVRPYMPTYMDLFAGALRKSWPTAKVRVHNASLPGATAAWGAEHVAEYVLPLKPDLVVIDFGMNDFWSVSPGVFGDSVRSIIRQVRRERAGAEFLLIANLQWDPAYVPDTDAHKDYFIDNFSGYRQALLSMEAPGIAVLDMTTLSEDIYRRKKPRDCLVNPLHPNDYMARWYAQGLAACLIGGGVGARTSGSRTEDRNE